MPNSFELLSFLVAEFVSQDTNSRWNFVGVYTNGMEYLEKIPEHFPPINLVFIIGPKKKDFKIHMKIMSPSGTELFKASTDINGNMEPPPEARFVWSFQLPIGIKTDEAGYYAIELSDGSEEHAIRNLLPINVRREN